MKKYFLHLIVTFYLNTDASVIKFSLALYFNKKTAIIHEQLGAAANFDELVKFGDRRQIRRSQMFMKLAFEFRCDVILMSHPITRSLASKLR